MAKGKLSDRQRDMIDFIRKFQNVSGYPPTIREIGEAVNITSTSVVNYNLNKLEKEGYITRDLKVSRGLRLVESLQEKADALSELIRIPIAGRIFASQPVHV
ncbi:MAG: winged helix DNA-binding protein, partial [Chloroflexi bacterium]|nr:winged helix DNA-binding protein [Chloroflexota bacterium]